MFVTVVVLYFNCVCWEVLLSLLVSLCTSLRNIEATLPHYHSIKIKSNSPGK